MFEYVHCLKIYFFSLCAEHRHFLELVHYSKNEAFFGLTTDEEFMKKIGWVRGHLFDDTFLVALNIVLGLCGLYCCAGPGSEQSHIANSEVHLTLLCTELSKCWENSFSNSDKLLKRKQREENSTCRAHESEPVHANKMDTSLFSYFLLNVLSSSPLVRWNEVIIFFAVAIYVNTYTLTSVFIFSLLFSTHVH